MLVEVNFGLLAKYLLFLDTAFLFFSAQLIYIRDVEPTGFYFEPDKSLTVLNAKDLLLRQHVVYLYWLLGHQYLLTLFVVGITGHLVCRLCFAYYFYFFLNLANVCGLLCGGYHRYLLWYDMESRSVVSVPALWSCSEGGDEDDDSDEYHAKKKHRKKSRKQRSTKRKRIRRGDEDEDDSSDDDDDIV
ncbi:hypothetical protein TYRP_008848 [Tyrophagus putrescentiae]|nr:hypothetical protein TYRP_008848 [Tyrophagus putrescentiae]